jgi:succinylglutamate desuccinylase
MLIFFKNFNPTKVPEVRLMGNIHGNEDQGIFILIPLINEMATSTDPDIVLLRQQMKLHILIS